jgi:hypothetical protein
MAITTLDGYLAAYKQYVTINKTNTVTTVAAQPSTLIDRAGIPAAGSLNPNQITNGLVPTDATTGYPPIAAFNGSNLGYVTNVMASTNVATGLVLYDVLFEAGQVTIPTSGTTVTSLTSQPSFAGRVPYDSGGVNRDYTTCELWARTGSVAWSNHAHSVTVTYVDDANNSPEATANASTQSFIINRMIRVPLNAGDRGVRQINSFTLNGIASAGGNVVIAVMRKIFAVRLVPGFNQFSLDQIGMPEVFGDSALLPVVRTDSTTSPVLDIQLEISEG